MEDWKAALCAERASAEDMGEGKGALVSAWMAWPAAWSICGTCCGGNSVSRICWRGEGSYLVYSVELLDAFGRGFLSLLSSICRWAGCDHGLG